MFIDLVLCKHMVDPRQYLFYAPAFSCLQKDDQVVVDTVRGNQTATVINSVTVDVDTEDYRFILDATNATLPLKRVISKVAYRELEYKPEKDPFYREEKKE